MTFDPETYRAVVRQIDSHDLLDVFTLDLVERKMGWASRHIVQRAELLRRLKPKVDRAKLSALIVLPGYVPGAVHDYCVKRFADLVERGEIPLEGESDRLRTAIRSALEVIESGGDATKAARILREATDAT